jgi:hypothetical protein
MYSGSIDISETTAASEMLALKYIPENRSILHWYQYEKPWLEQSIFGSFSFVSIYVKDC